MQFHFQFSVSETGIRKIGCLPISTASSSSSFVISFCGDPKSSGGCQRAFRLDGRTNLYSFKLEFASSSFSYLFLFLRLSWPKKFLMAPKINISRVIELEMGINLDHNFTFHFHFRCSNFSQENCWVPVKSSYFFFPFNFFFFVSVNHKIFKWPKNKYFTGYRTWNMYQAVKILFKKIVEYQ